MKKRTVVTITLVLLLAVIIFFGITYSQKSKITKQQQENARLAQQARDAEAQAKLQKDSQTITAKDLANLIASSMNKEASKDTTRTIEINY